ncbi:MAG: hypothetical protein WA056_01635 [Gallionella sp.]
MKTIFQDRIIRKLAQACAKLSYRLGQHKPPSAFIHAAMFTVNGENRLRDEDGLCLGAIELELLGWRDALREQLQTIHRIQPERTEPMSDQTITPDNIETDGIVYSYATACVQAMREAAESATAEGFIHLAAHKLTEVGYPATSGGVASFLHETLRALTETGEELRRVNHANTAPNPENPSTEPR